jgi:hypothetical protein
MVTWTLLSIMPAQRPKDATLRWRLTVRAEAADSGIAPALDSMACLWASSYSYAARSTGVLGLRLAFANRTFVSDRFITPLHQGFNHFAKIVLRKLAQSHFLSLGGQIAFHEAQSVIRDRNDIYGTGIVCRFENSGLEQKLIAHPIALAECGDRTLGQRPPSGKLGLGHRSERSTPAP